MEANIWFYTFSTVAQVVAALIGLFAVFVVYKMQDFGDVLESVRKKFVSIVSYASGNTDDYPSIPYEQALVMSDSILLGHITKLLDIFHNPQKPQIPVEGLTQENHDLFKTLVATKRTILRKFAITLILSLIAIALSVLALILASVFIGSGYEALFQLGFFTYFVFCLGYMGVGVYQIATT